MCKCAEGGSSTSVLRHLSESLPQAPKFYYPPLSVRLDFQPLSILKQKSWNGLDVDSDMRSVLTKTSPRILRLL